ncbi:MAG: hypothetical protein EBT02_06360 [Planctomycetia bacterium]|nr:hypothetical protein [Planctomycetia bacterium]
MHYLWVGCELYVMKDKLTAFVIECLRMGIEINTIEEWFLDELKTIAKTKPLLKAQKEFDRAP